MADNRPNGYFAGVLPGSIPFCPSTDNKRVFRFPTAVQHAAALNNACDRRDVKKSAAFMALSR
ncbi:hypothetical protein [Chimaeribacter arupi]|uniref:hypothetical protein n=1 Tax=Chimaeribacter arupi TaxID=2060066 RepID=UPI0029441BE0|nr:hypothetical protein [Chimaeribacter arupi]MDV5140113.1 hypothetical protein [Chimaeribacter arupi]